MRPIFSQWYSHVQREMVEREMVQREMMEHPTQTACSATNGKLNHEHRQQSESHEESRLMNRLSQRVRIACFAFLTCLASANFAERCSAQVKTTMQTLQHLLVDDQMLAQHDNVRRVLGKPVKSNSGKPIFTAGWFYGTVLYDAGRFKLWFRKPGSQGYGYAESSDGLAFQEKADVTGINFAGDYTLAVEIDSQEAEADHRFKAAYDAPGMAAGLAHSADGIRWTPYNQGRPVTTRAADTYNQLIWDPLKKTYRLFTRTDFGSAGGAGEIRGTRSMTNPDIKADPSHFQLVREWIFDRTGKAESQRRQIYATTCWIYRDIYFALLTVYEHPGDVSEGQTTDHGTRHERDEIGRAHV